MVSSQERLPYTVLIVEADPAVRAMLRKLLSETYFVQEADTLDGARVLLGQVPVHALIVRDRLPDGDGAALCVDAAADYPDAVRLLYGDTVNPREALQAINRGHIWRYLPAPWQADDLCRALTHGLQAGGRDDLHATINLLERKVEQRTREVVALNEELRIAYDKLQMLTTTDELTGLCNRRILLERLDEGLREVHRYHVALSCVVGDIRDFHRVNQGYGTEVGDALLQEAARRVRLRIREVDLPSRCGSDAFALLLPHTNHLQARIVAERLYRALCLEPYAAESGAIPLQFTFGIAEATSSVANGPELLRRAETAERLARSTAARIPIVTYDDQENAVPEGI